MNRIKLVIVAFLGLIISIGIYLLGKKLQMDIVEGIGISLFTGVIVGVFCNVIISDYFRDRDKKDADARRKSNECSRKANAQIDSLNKLVTCNQEVIASLNAYFKANPQIKDGEIGTGYYELCKSLYFTPEITFIDSTILDEEDCRLIVTINHRYKVLLELIEAKRYSKIDNKKFILESLTELSSLSIMFGKCQQLLNSNP